MTPRRVVVIAPTALAKCSPASSAWRRQPARNKCVAGAQSVDGQHIRRRDVAGRRPVVEVAPVRPERDDGEGGAKVPQHLRCPRRLRRAAALLLNDRLAERRTVPAGTPAMRPEPLAVTE